MKQAIKDFIDLYGRDSEGYDPDSYVVTDFDNTSCIFDIQDQCLMYQLETMAFALDPDRMDSTLRENLDGNFDDVVSDISNAYRNLYGKHGPFSPKGSDDSDRIVEDPWWSEFASKMLVMEKLAATHVDNWRIQWLTGMTEQEIYDLTYRSCSKYGSLPTFNRTVAGPDDIGSLAGPMSATVLNGLTVDPLTKWLWKTLMDNGIDVWVCSASEVNQVRAAIDCFGLHCLCAGVTGKTMRFDEEGRMLPFYDFDTGRGWLSDGDGWRKDIYDAKGSCRQEGKIETIVNAIMPHYNGRQPLAGFMDSTGDFNFCTEFEMKLVVCVNRGDRKVTDGGSLIAEIAEYEKNVLDYDLKKANDSGDTYYVLVGRDENGMRCLRDCPRTVSFGSVDERLFADGDNEALYNRIVEEGMSVKEALESFCLKTPADSPGNTLGFEYGFLDAYRGYHSIV